MTPKKNYSRYFIILQEDEKGYSLESDKTPSGYAKLEMKNSKCKISYYVQNLKKEKQPYYMVLICGKKDVNKIIKVGKLNIDDHGRVDIFYEYDMDNIADTAISSEKIIGAAIVKFLDANVISIMSGFSTTDKPNDWKNYKLADANTEKKETRTEEVINEFDEYEQNIELIKVKSNDQVEHVNEKTDTEKRVKDENVELLETQENVVEKEVKEEVKEEDAMKRVKVENAEHLEKQENIPGEDEKETDEEKRVKAEISEQLEEEIEVDKQEEDFEANRHKNKKQYKENYPKGNMGNFFKVVAQDFEEVPNFSKEIKWCKWYKVPVHNLENMHNLHDYNKYTIVYYPMIRYYPYIRNHKSFMLGYKCDSGGEMKYIVYGIPGSKAKAHQPYGGKTGFVTWISDNNSDNNNNNNDNEEMGHWLMFYDFKNSTIVVPIKK